MVYGPAAKSIKEGERCLAFDFPANPGIVDIFLDENSHLTDEAVIHRFKVQSDFNTPVSRDQVEAVVYSKAAERLTHGQAVELCEERYYKLFPALKESADAKPMSPVSENETDLVSFIRQVSDHCLVPVEGTTDFWLIRGSFEPDKEKSQVDDSHH